MYSLKNKIVFITGASSGIGKACAEQFAAAGAHLILTARRLDKIQALADKLTQEHQVKTLPILLDVQDRNMVEEVIGGLPKEWQAIDILVNNAGLALSSDLIQESDPDNWDTMIDTNIKGLLYVTRNILPGMIEHNKGHIVNIGSIAGYDYYPRGNIYCATKHAVKALNQSMRLDLLGTPIRVTEVSPGLVETEFSEVRWQDKTRAKEFYEDFNPLCANDIADAVIYCTSRPLHVNIENMIVMPTDQASCNHLNLKGGVATSMYKFGNTHKTKANE